MGLAPDGVVLICRLTWLSHEFRPKEEIFYQKLAFIEWQNEETNHENKMASFMCFVFPTSMDTAKSVPVETLRPPL